jgi:phosphosulfolactate phosphohydrolase-like enzyme
MAPIETSRAGANPEPAFKQCIDDVSPHKPSRACNEDVFDIHCLTTVIAMAMAFCHAGTVAVAVDEEKFVKVERWVIRLAVII